MNTEVLIIGAGPTGLVLAIELARRGVAFRIIDRAAEPGLTSRALAVQARTLEFYQALGFADEVVAEGRKMVKVNLHVKGKDVASVRIGDAGLDLSPYPFLLVYPQDEHERLLIRKLEALGVQVERQSTLVDLSQDPAEVTATIQKGDGSTEVVTAAYVCGCDGAHSAVRKLTEIKFPGGTYEQAFFVSDVLGSGPTADGELHACPGKTDVCLVFPMKGEGHIRLVGTIPKEVDSKVEDHTITFDHLRDYVAQQASLTVSKVLWFSTYRIHHRVAEAFQRGRIFLLGDAGHVHSPVGGQGMNTGIGDAVNLGWKLAEVLHRGAPSALLATYEPERIGFARKLVATTDRAFARLLDPSRFGSFLRIRLMPFVMATVTRFRFVRRAMFKLVSQTSIEYRDSPLSHGKVGEIWAGDRLPWVPLGKDTSNFDPLKRLDWQVHVYGTPTDELRTYCEQQSLALEVFPFGDAALHRGLQADALYLIRPDGYVAFASEFPRSDALAAYLESNPALRRAEPLIPTQATSIENH